MKIQSLLIGLIIFIVTGCAVQEKSAPTLEVPITNASEDYGEANSQCRLKSWKSPKSAVITSRKIYNQCMDEKGFREIQ